MSGKEKKPIRKMIMKSIKKTSLLVAAVFTFGSVAMANNGPESRGKTDPKAHAERMTERMAKEYELNDIQKQQLLELNQAVAEKMGQRPAGADRPGRPGNRGDMARSGKDRKSPEATPEKKEKRERGEGRAERPQRSERPDAPKFSAEEREKLLAERKQARENYNTELQKIMNAGQFEVYAKKQAELEQKRQERAEKMKENRSRRSGTGKKAIKPDTLFICF